MTNPLSGSNNLFNLPSSTSGPASLPGVSPRAQGAPPPLTDPTGATITVGAPASQPADATLTVAEQPTATELPPADAGGVRHARLGTSDKKAPTMEVVKKLVIEAYGGDPPPDLDTNLSKYVTGFSSTPKKTPDGATVLDTYGRDPKFYQCDVTFKIQVKGPRDETVTIDFIQTVQTRTKVPMAGDSRAIKESQMDALFKIAGYRQSIEEPVLRGQNERIQALMGKANLKIEVMRYQPKIGETLTWYGHNVRKLDEKPGKTAEKTLYVYQQSIIASVRVEGKRMDLYQDIRSKAELAPETIWNTKVSCPALDKRDEALGKAYRAAAGSNLGRNEVQENTTINEIRGLTLPEHAPPDKPTGMGLSLNEVQHIVGRDCRFNLENLDSMLSQRGPIADFAYVPLKATDTKVDSPSMQAHIDRYRSTLESLRIAKNDQSQPESQLRILQLERQAEAEMEVILGLQNKVNQTFTQIKQQIATLECIDRNAQTPVELEPEGDVAPDPNADRVVQMGSLTKTQHDTVKSTLESHKKFHEKNKLESRVADFNNTLKIQVSQLRREFGADAPGMQKAAQQVGL